MAKALLVQMELHGRLARVEWEIEKNRLQQSLLMMLLGFACLICALLSLNILIISLSWATDYRIHAILALIAFYLLGLVLCCLRLTKLGAKSAQTFCATRAEVSADIELMRSQL
jgi:uncharacterized membrane protein YqjE